MIYQLQLPVQSKAGNVKVVGKAGVSTGRRQKATGDDSIICYARSLQDKMQQQQQQQQLLSGNCHAEYVHLGNAVQQANMVLLLTEDMSMTIRARCNSVHACSVDDLLGFLSAFDPGPLPGKGAGPDKPNAKQEAKTPGNSQELFDRAVPAAQQDSSAGGRAESKGRSPANASATPHAPQTPQNASDPSANSISAFFPSKGSATACTTDNDAHASNLTDPENAPVTAEHLHGAH